MISAAGKQSKRRKKDQRLRSLPVFDIIRQNAVDKIRVLEGLGPFSLKKSRVTFLENIKLFGKESIVFSVGKIK